MSETDDTDVLLLIPPNFFLVQSSGSEESLLESSRTVVHKPVSCTAQVLGKLVTQVHTLESRLDSLEINSDISSLGAVSRSRTWDTTDSIDSRSIDRKCFTFPRRRRRKISKKKRSHDLSLTSLDTVSTQRKTIPSLNLNSNETFHSKLNYINDNPSMEGDLSSIVSTPSKKHDKLLLHEIDEFLTKVEKYEMPDSKSDNFESTLCPENVIKATADYFTQKLDCNNTSEDFKLPSGRVVSSNILDKYIYLVKNNPPTARSDKHLSTNYRSNDEQSISHLENSSKLDTDISKQEIKSPSVRKLNFSEKEVQPTSTPKRIHTHCLNSFKPTSKKIYDRASKVLEQYKAQSYKQNTQTSVTGSYISPSKPDFKMPQLRPYCPENGDTNRFSLAHKYVESMDTDLLSLSELWGDKGDRDERSDNLKLEEERLKREHCESMIQQLQKKILEQQEKLAVAIKVDRCKDAAISKLREAWLRLTGNLDKAEERHRQALEKMMNEVENFRMVAGDAQKKTNHFEAELYKTLDLAHDYQEKNKQLTTDKKLLEERLSKNLAEHDDVIARKDKEIDVLKENYETVMRLNKQSTDCVKTLEDTLEKEKSDHEQTKCSVTELNLKIQLLKDEAALIIQEKDLLKTKVSEERSRANILEKQLAEKQNQTSELLKKCDNLDEEVKCIRKLLDVQKVELKGYYQKQLEDAVVGKLQEFQQQLDLAQREMEDEARAKENSIIDTFNKQISRIEEQHKLEVSVLEEKQKEEIKLYRLQLAQASEKISLLENKLESFRRRRGQIASQLHGVMEAQWRQALLILTNGNNNPSSLDITRPDSVPTVASEYPLPPLSPPGRSRTNTRSQSLAHAQERSQQKMFDGLTDTELQQYVKLLLKKPATLECSGESVAEPQRDTDEPTSDRHDSRDKIKRSLANKPPWKA